MEDVDTSPAHNGFDSDMPVAAASAFVPVALPQNAFGSSAFGDLANADPNKLSAELEALIASVRPANIKVFGFEVLPFKLPKYTVPVSSGDGVVTPKEIQVKSIDGRNVDMVECVAYAPISESDMTTGEYNTILQEMVNNVLYPALPRSKDDIAAFARIRTAKAIRPHYERWKNKTGQAVTGRPLSTFPGVPSIYLATLRQANINTVEELAEASVEVLRNLPNILDGEELKTIAQNEINRTKQAEPAMRHTPEVERMKRELAEMKDMVKQLLPAAAAQAKGAEAKPTLNMPGKKAA